MTPRGKRIGLLVALAVLAAVAVAGWVFSGRSAAADGEDWVEVQREDLVTGVEVSGTLGAVQSVQLGPPQVPGLYDYKLAFMAPEGMEVRQGQPVLGFDSSELERTLLEKMAERDQAQTELEKRQTDLDLQLGEARMQLAEAEATQRRAALKADVPADLVAGNELQQNKADLELAEKRIAFNKERLVLRERQGRAELDALRNKRDRAAQRVAETEAAIQKMTIVSPRDGTVVYISNRGEKKKVGDTCWNSEKVIEIPDLRRMKAEGQVDEADAGRVEVGQPVRLALDAHPDVTFTGRVRAIRGAVGRKSRFNALKVVALELELDRTDPQRMRPGMRFLGTIEIDRAPEALVIPAEAVANRAGGPVVYRRGRWEAEEVPVKLGRRNERLVEVLDGLSAGDRVLRRPPAGEDA
ncbi:MAG TPA: efflux RND transporter periplasmic adaptor subunit [Thermoanaerobaculia bacterium]|nr:efflux RND transporter periplasmic adaptor subunit [Thermoanaerobaculia bacterium]